MNKQYFTIIVFLFCTLLTFEGVGQSLPVGTIGLEEFYRRKQLLGELDSTVSFSIRPIFPKSTFGVNSAFDPDSTLNDQGYLRASGPIKFFKGLGEFQVLPFSWLQQYNSNHPYGWNDGAMIPARGYQTILSGGFFAKIGPLSIQLRPEFVYAQNTSFDGYATGRSDFELQKYYTFYNLYDAPERFGNKSFSNTNWGQSSIRLTFGPASIGLSNENIWWGPGIQNAIMFTNNAPGFKHLTFNTVKPIKTPIGSFEAQIIAGKLEESGFSPLEVTTSSDGASLFKTYNSDWRYLSGFNINYQPKWVPGLFLGFTRDFVSFSNDVKTFKDYFPFFFPVQKKTTGSQGDPFERDQHISMYARWLFQKAHAEVYFEYGLNDNAYNYRDFIGSPDHARAYIFGFTKLIALKSRKDEFIQINAEIDQLSQSVDRLVRASGGFYQHSQITQGYTHKGQVIGAGTGSGGNIQTLSVNWVKRMNKLGLSFERYEHNIDFSNDLGNVNNQVRNWVDFAFGAEGVIDYKNFIFSAKLQGIKSLNYQWRMKDYTPDEYYIPHNDVFNIRGQLGVTFRF